MVKIESLGICAAALLVTLTALSPAPAQGDNTAIAGFCTEIEDRSVTENFRFTPSSDNEAFAKSIPASSRIGSIRIQRLSVFNLEDPEEDKWLYGVANNIHSLTRENVVRDQLLFAEGDDYNLARLRESERILRDLRFIYDAAVRPWRQCGDVVDVEVITRDIWTFTPLLSFSRSGGQNKYAFGFRDTNFLGTGKQIVLKAESDEERSGITFLYKDPAVLGSRWEMGLGITDNDDGFDHSLIVVRPFFSVYEKWSLGTILQQYKLQQTNWFRGDEVEEFDHEGGLYRVFGGFAQELEENHRVGRWLYGYHLETNDFSYSDSDIPPPQLPATRDYSYPFFGYQSIKDEYTEIVNVNYLGRTEDFYTGESYEWTLGWSDESLGSTKNQLALNARYGNTFLSNADHLWTAETSVDGYYDPDDETFENLWWRVSTHYHMKQSRKWAVSARLRLDYTDGLTEDEQLTLGGDNGLRGYDQNYQVGDRSFVFNLEQRYYSDWHPFRLARVGAAAFVDVGRAWFKGADNGPNGGVLADVGIGLRLNSSRASKGSVVHLDLAFPLMSGEGVDSVQFLIKVRDTF